jgi:peptidoglycan/xylan/chitin deacetylase (PgdA/CDA1 family)
MNNEKEETDNKIEENSHTHASHEHHPTKLMVVLFCLLIIVVVGALIFRQHQDHKVKQTTSTQTTKFNNVDFDTVVEWNDQYRLHVMYPITKQGDLDQNARAKIDKYVNDFRKLVSIKPKGSKPYELNIVGAVNYASDTAINFIYTGTWDTGGQPSNLTINSLFDRKTGKEIRTSDLFKDNDYLQTASGAARKALPGILGTMAYNKTLVEQGTSPTTDHFDQFEIKDEKTINIIFEPGQVADVSLGTVKVPLALDSLQSDLNDDVVSTVFPDYVAQVKAAEKQKAEAAAAAAKKAAEAAQSHGGQSLPANGKTDCAKVKCIALSFDDGPGPGTATILDTLKKYSAHATFMVVGSRVAPNAALLQREHAEGHDIGNHTWDHADLTNLSAAAAANEVNSTADAVAKVVGKRPYFVRPPYGAYNKAVEAELNVPLILWNVDPDDWKDRNADIVYQRIMAGAKPGAILLSHDIYTTTAAAYQRIIPDLIQQGYTLVTVSDLLDLNPATAGAGVYSHQ